MEASPSRTVADVLDSQHRPALLLRLRPVLYSAAPFSAAALAINVVVAYVLTLAGEVTVVAVSSNALSGLIRFLERSYRCSLSLLKTRSFVLDVYLIKIGDMPVLTMNMVTMIVAAVVTVLVMMLAAKAIQTGPESEGNDRYLTKSALGQLVEAIVVYLRDEMLVPVMGAQGDQALLPCLLTLFFFILINNLLGMIPLLDIQHLLGIHGRRSVARPQAI